MQIQSKTLRKVSNANFIVEILYKEIMLQFFGNWMFNLLKLRIHSINFPHFIDICMFCPPSTYMQDPARLMLTHFHCKILVCGTRYKIQYDLARGSKKAESILKGDLSDCWSLLYVTHQNRQPATPTKLVFVTSLHSEHNYLQCCLCVRLTQLKAPFAVEIPPIKSK